MQPFPERLTPPEMIVYAGKYMFDRFLTDAAGGNLSLREDDTIYFSPTMAGTNYHWNIGVEDVVAAKVNELDALITNPRFTREGLSHIAIHKAFPYVKAIVHAHPLHIKPFIASSRPIPAILSAAKHFGTLEYHAAAKSYSQDQAEKIVACLRNQEERIKNRAAAVLMPRHGIIIASAHDMMITLDSLERIDNNAYAVLSQKLLD
jgi:L-fuculose-phosphate aldolase